MNVHRVLLELRREGKVADLLRQIPHEEILEARPDLQKKLRRRNPGPLPGRRLPVSSPSVALNAALAMGVAGMAQRFIDRQRRAREKRK